MYFEYLKTETYLDSIDIEDIGNTCIDAVNDEAFEWLLKIETNLGWTKIKQIGPFILDSDTMNSSFQYSTWEHEYNEKKIISTIKQFINNPRYNISQLFVCENELFDNRLKSIVL